MKKAALSMSTFVAALLVSVAVPFGGSQPAIAQNPNPQRSFAAQEYLAKPSLVLNFNDLTPSFKERVSGLNFVNTETVVAPAPIGGTPPSGMAYDGYFNGTNDYIHAASALSSSSIFSYAGWVYLPNSSMSGTFFSNGTSTNVGGTGVWVGVGSLNGQPGNGNYLNVLSSSVAWQGAPNVIGTGWHFIAVTRDGTTMRAYIDGVQTGTLANSTVTPIAPSGGVFMGQSQTATTNLFPWFRGNLSNWVMYNVALTSAQINTLYSNGSISSGLVGQWKLNEGTGSTAIDSSTGGNNGTWVGTASGNVGYYAGTITTVYTSGTVAVRQPGFDLTQPNNTSAGFPYNGFNVAPNNTLGAIEWNVPWSMVVHIDRLNWNRTGTLVLASKGDISSLSNNWWEFTLAMNGAASQLCFIRNGVLSAGSAKANAGGGVCTAAGYDAMPNGLSYDIILTDNGNGTPNALTLTMNGLTGTGTGGSSQMPVGWPSTSYQYGFGAVNLTISGGTGYANSTAFTSTGGGPNCNVRGSIAATSGVPTAGVLGPGSFNYFNAGCASLPTIVLTSPTGTGISIAESLAVGSMNDPTLPLMVPGVVSTGAYNGIDQSDSTQTSTYVDEFAIFPGVISAVTAQGLFGQTKFYQTILGAVPAVKKNIIIDEDGCNDLDDAMAVAMAIRYHLLGYANLLGVVSEVGGTDAAMYRQMLDQAGLNHVPMSVASGWVGGGGYCSAANITTYNASTPQTTTAYPSAVSMYRKAFAALPSTPIYVLMGGPFTGMADFMKSPADGISSLTGQQLFNQNGTNGGFITVQGLGGCNATAPPNTLPCSATIGGDNSMSDYLSGQYFFSNHGTVPIYASGGTPPSSGPGMYNTRTHLDPIYLEEITNGADTRTCWDCMAAAELLTNYFVGGTQLGVSGGTGYANSTAFTSTGGGAGCSVTGLMVSASGVPNGTFQYSWGGASNSYAGFGSKCLTAPTIVLTAPTGTGAVVTAYPTSVCGTDTITSGTNATISSSTCGYTYWQPYAVNVMGAGGGTSATAFQWFTNSLLNPAPGGDPRMQ